MKFKGTLNIGIETSAVRLKGIKSSIMIADFETVS